MDSYTIQDIQFQENVLRKGEAMIIGAVGGIIVVLAIALLEKLKLDDPVGAIAVHLFAEIAFETVRVDFAEKLFEGSNADFQRIMSMLNSKENKAEAIAFIEQQVRPDYDWSDKEGDVAAFIAHISQLYEA